MADSIKTLTLAQIYEMQGLKEDALKIYREILLESPENKEAQMAIKRLMLVQKYFPPLNLAKKELFVNPKSQEDSNTLPTHQNISIQTTPTPPVANPFWQNENIREECEFLEMLQERLLVLFEGLCAEHNQDIQTKLNLTINFLEYELSVINERLNDIKK